MEPRGQNPTPRMGSDAQRLLDHMQRYVAEDDDVGPMATQFMLCVSRRKRRTVLQGKLTPRTATEGRCHANKCKHTPAANAGCRVQVLLRV